MGAERLVLSRGGAAAVPEPEAVPGPASLEAEVLGAVTVPVGEAPTLADLPEARVPGSKGFRETCAEAAAELGFDDLVDSVAAVAELGRLYQVYQLALGDPEMYGLLEQLRDGFQVAVEVAELLVADAAERLGYGGGDVPEDLDAGGA